MKKETYAAPVMEIVLLERGKTVVTSGCGVGDYLNCTGYDPCYLDGSCPSDCSGNCPQDGLCSTDGDSCHPDYTPCPRDGVCRRADLCDPDECLTDTCTSYIYEPL